VPTIQASSDTALVPQRRGRQPFRIYYNRKRAAEVARAAKTRLCLMCSRNFRSQGAGHRVCDNCKGSEAWLAGNWL
jgi:hypothetical protein